MAGKGGAGADLRRRKSFRHPSPTILPFAGFRVDEPLHPADRDRRPSKSTKIACQSHAPQRQRPESVHRDESHAVFARERHGGIHVVDNSHRDAIGGVDGVGHFPVQHTCSEVYNRPDAKATELGR